MSDMKYEPLAEASNEIPPSLTFEAWLETKTARDAYAMWLKKTQLEEAKTNYDRALAEAKAQFSAATDRAEMTFVTLTILTGQ